MGSSHSCLPVSIPTLHSHHSAKKSEYNVEEAFNRSRNAININEASEDELLLLPGISRQLAVNIVQHRQVRQGFKKVDDILQVRGINVHLFERIASDIVFECPSSTRTKQEPVDLNTASYEQLCSVPDLTVNHVKRILQRRKRKGSFHFIEDLLNIRGINYVILAKIRPYVTVKQNTLPASISNYSLDNYPSLFHRPPPVDTHSLASMLLETMPVELQALLIPSSSYRSIATESENIFRFASWNLDKLTKEKVKNPGVREVICRVILEQNFSLIGIQEISDREAIDLIIEELNHPTIPLIKDWPKHQHKKWNFLLSDSFERNSADEYLGFIYDESNGVEWKETSLFKSNAALIASFCIHRKFDFVFVNVHFNEFDCGEAVSALIQTIDDTIECKRRLLFGTFGRPPASSEFQPFIQGSYSPMIEQNTDIHLDKLDGSSCTDNIWLSSEAQTFHTGKSGVIRANLNSFWIPAGWTWGGLVSSHCPIWTELKLSSS